MKRIAVVGSAYNPPTLGHVDVIHQALEQADEAWLVPAFHHAWGKVMAPYPERCAMARELVTDLADPRVRLMAVEHQIAADGPVYSFDLLTFLDSQLGRHHQLLLVLGPDNVAAIAKFYRGEELKQRWPLITAMERVAVRSTLVRERLTQGQSIDELTTPSVARYLATHPLYQPGGSA